MLALTAAVREVVARAVDEGVAAEVSRTAVITATITVMVVTRQVTPRRSVGSCTLS